jgi:carboxymethylenebutenolidase
MTLRDIFGLIVTALLTAGSALAEPATVYFPSADGNTRLVGYLFMPSTTGPHPAVVMLHGLAGPYSANNNRECTLVAEGTQSACNAATLSKRHQSWGEYWAEHGFVALLPDSFGPRGKARGFSRFTHGDADREDVNERTVQPLDAEGALKYLQSRSDVTAQRIYLQGWSNGASTTLNVMYRQAQAGGSGFRAAMAFYPGCGPDALLSRDYETTAPITVFLGSDDEEVSPEACHRVLDPAAGKGSPVTLVGYEDATHDFDDPGRKRQREPGTRRRFLRNRRSAAGVFAGAEVHVFEQRRRY